MDKMKHLARLLVLSAGMLCAVSCGNNAGGGETPSSGSAVSSSISGSVAQQFTVRFNSCGGTAVDKKVVTAGSKIQTAPTTTRDGYSFEGWCTEYNGSQGTAGTEVTFPLTVNENMMLYARWTKASAGSHTQEQIDAYIESLKQSSVKDHVYFHYYRFDNKPASYSDWDIWCWPYRPKEGEGARFDWTGRTTSADKLSATGDAIVDEFGGAVADIDLTKEYDGGAKNRGKTIGGTKVSFYQKDGVTLDTQIGIQVVKSSTRGGSGEFWTNDGGDLHVDLTKPEEALAIQTTDGGTAWHIFALQDKVASYGSKVINDMSDPFEDDDGKKVTRGNAAYNDVNWNETAPIQATAGSFASGVGVGYQIQVACFADSDGDGFGDIYGITSKLDYLKKLGVKALWLTPVQKSDSYHGYDISDYEAVDAKYGSSVSTAAKANGNKVTPATAMADYEELIKKAHDNGMKVIMDLVLNHTSTSNKWFISSAQLDDDYRGYYQWGNHETDSGVTEKKCWYPYGDHAYSYYAKFGSSMPELNYQYKATRKAVEDMSLYWCAKGVDGFRLDAVKHIFMTDEVVSGNKDTLIMDVAAKGDYSSNLTKNLHFYRELNKAVKSKYPNTFFVGENFDGHAYHVSPWYQAFDSMFDFYGYFNLTSAAAHAHGNYTAGPTFGSMMTKTDTFSIDGSIKDKSGIYNGVSGSKKWNLVDVVSSYNHYRNGKAMPGFFTSNHDIARVINRCAGTTGNADGLDEQGSITANNYPEYRKLSDCVKAAEILLPGLTWIYYGDEIGMTGNFPSGKTSASDYADLWWRQPMKWTQGGKVQDGSMTTGFSITGSAASIVWDNINSTDKVVPANTQMNDTNSEFSKLAKVIAFKNANPGMITGTLSDQGSDTNNLKFKNGDVTVTINFKNYTVSTSGGSGSLNISF
ncbi:MAG: InlB B-repeat-containing protein [Bacilli bacterium]|nr:InlB B-repeat-containing protein [Bacilli bacterium]